MSSSADLATAYVAGIHDALSYLSITEIEQVAGFFERAYENDQSIFIMGNGGSAATASHLAADLSKNTRSPGCRPVRALPLTDQAPLITALANDDGYETIFQAQLATLARSGDLVVAISTSGQSVNVVKAMRWAAGENLPVVALLGHPGGHARALADAAVLVRAARDQQEDVHLMVGHFITRYMREVVRSGPASNDSAAMHAAR
jgi:D-sedoheptulose 7-phosphate isomerase